MLSVFTTPIAYSPTPKPVSSHACSVGFEGSSIGITSYKLAAPKAECKPKWTPFTAEVKGEQSVCRVVFNSASVPKYFDGEEYSALAYANGATFSGRVEGGACHFATRDGLEVYASVFEVLSRDCEIEWFSPDEMKKEPVGVDEMSAPSLFLCSTQYPASEWMHGWMDASVTRATESVGDRRKLESSPSPSPEPVSRFEMKLSSSGDVSDFTDAKKLNFSTTLAAALSGNGVTISPFQIDLTVTAGSVNIVAAVANISPAAANQLTAVARTPQFQTGVGQFMTQNSLGTVTAYSVSSTCTANCSGDDGLSGGALAGIIIGSIVGFGLLVGLIMMALKPGSTQSTQMMKGEHKSNEHL